MEMRRLIIMGDGLEELPHPRARYPMLNYTLLVGVSCQMGLVWML